MFAKWSLVPPQRTLWRSDHTRGPSGSRNGRWHLPSDRMGPIDLAQCPRGLLNGPWHIPSARTGPSNFAQGSSRSQMFPGTSPARERAPATFCDVPATCQMVPGPSLAHGPQRLRAVSQWLAKWFLAPIQSMHGAQRPRAGSQQLAKWSDRTGSSDFARGLSSLPNGPIARAPATSRGVSAACQMVRSHGLQRLRAGSQQLAKWSDRTGSSDFARGLSSLPNGPIARAPATSRGVSAACQMVRSHGLQRLRAGSQQLAKWSDRTGSSDFARGLSSLPNGPIARAPATSRGVSAACQMVRSHGLQRLRAGSQQLAKWSDRTGSSDFARGLSSLPNGPIARAPATSRGVSAACQMVRSHGLQRLRAGSQQLAKWSDRTGSSDFARGLSSLPNGPIARAPATSRGVSAACQMVRSHGLQRLRAGSQQLAKWSDRTGSSDFARGLSSLPNGPIARAPATSRGVSAACQMVRSHGLQRLRAGSQQLAKWSDRTGSSDFARGLSSLPNGPIARAPATSRGVSAACQMVRSHGLQRLRAGSQQLAKWSDRTGSSDFARGLSSLPNGPIARAPATSRGVSAACQMVRSHGLQRLRAGSQQLAKWSDRTGSSDFARGLSSLPNGPIARAPATSRGVSAACQMVRSHGLQRLRAGSQQLAKWSDRTGSSDFARGLSSLPNGPIARAPATSRGVSAACQMVRSHGLQRLRAGSQQLAKWSLAHPQRTHWPSNLALFPSGSPNGTWFLPSARTGSSDLAQGPSGSPNGPWPLNSRRMGAQRPRAGSQRLAKWSMAPAQCTHCAQRPHAGTQRLIKWAEANPQCALLAQRPCAESQRLAK
ncbi:UNVERIFIED_CONTAM: hypothetical protein FKN15_001134 [Acipenser sinensis]